MAAVSEERDRRRSIRDGLLNGLGSAKPEAGLKGLGGFANAGGGGGMFPGLSNW